MTVGAPFSMGTLDVSFYSSNEKIVEFTGHRRGHIPGASVPFSRIRSVEDLITETNFLDSSRSISRFYLLQGVG